MVCFDAALATDWNERYSICVADGDVDALTAGRIANKFCGLVDRVQAALF